MTVLLNSYLATAPVTPLSYSGSVLWLEGGLSKITHASDAISAWADSSANAANSANQATAGRKPTRITDTSKDVASFATDDVLAVTNHSSLNTTSLTIVGAIDLTTISAYGVLAQKRSGSTGWMIYNFNGAGTDLSFGVNFTTDCIIRTGGGLAGRHTFSARLSGTTAVTKWDGAGGNTNASMGTLTTNAVDLLVGAGDTAGGGPYNGAILDLAVWDNDIGATNTAAIEAAWKTKWGTT